MILITHYTGEPHGILGAQAACTYLTKQLQMPSIVVGIARQFSQGALLQFLDSYYAGQDKIIGFSHLCGRADLIALIGAVKERGYFTILGGPQAEKDYYGEIDFERHETRFPGLHKVIDLAIQGPIDHLTHEHLSSTTGCLNFPWKKDILIDVDWTNLYFFSDSLKRCELKTAQVLNAIGCPYATRKKTVSLPLPDTIQAKSLCIDVESWGCIFCDVARDKGFHGQIDRSGVISQIRALPEEKGRKIPFELIDEYPISSLHWIIEETARAGMQLSRIELVCRVDDINTHPEILADLLKTAQEQRLTIQFASIGFESFSDRILGLLNKGITVNDIVRCVEILRQLKERYGETLLYRRSEGSNHGFIHPTPWDDPETIAETDRSIALHGFSDDILPPHSVPLIIHHASYLGDWIRQIEFELQMTFKRAGTWIEWWSPPVNNA
jgi:hypothetical protein